MTNTLTATIDIDATPEQVWSIVSDLKRMGEWSPQCRKMRVSGPVGRGAKTFNLNRRGLLVWPTTSKVVEFEPNRKLAFRINENRSVWSYELIASGAGTTVTETREAPNGTTAISRFLVDKLMGGTEGFEREMVEGMNATLARIKSEAEAR
ncbi:SRPBCC family protein [Rhodococcus sp. D2-41]|uniref:SRPBCC family protein n=1 Tax=Speluncibacter jeojiensis TaxID=2710754 RepID=A0A9X4M1W4_9ACTN|nr:SRPBCC family protein [Rhodococcus sp. D2-41]MDG3009996.1 SRPBCC family protein [Rhodococcus sp. D2-41]MDG3016299.1 SRPBCC family protein [Corynebacteriales bacterium D3-21]